MISIKEQELGAVNFLHVSQLVMVQVMDELWSDHLDAMQDLREGIGLRGIAQRDPLVEYKNESFNFFDHLMVNIRSGFARRILKIHRVTDQSQHINARTNVNQIQDILTGSREMVDAVKRFLTRKQQGTQKAVKELAKPQTVVHEAKVGRNDPCPCGSGKKYKKCHGKNI
jgi:preprotein translocase subunit SecA